jgi:hypothetical protein
VSGIDGVALGELINQLVKAKEAIEAGGFSDPDTTRVVVTTKQGEWVDLNDVVAHVPVIGADDPAVVIRVNEA